MALADRREAGEDAALYFLDDNRPSRAQRVPPYYGSCCVFRVIKTQHEEGMGDFPREVEGRFFKNGKNMAKKRSVFLHATIRHAADK